MKKVFLFLLILISVSCSRVDPFVVTKRLSPLHDEIKIFWSEDITEVTLNNTVIRKQGVYYLIPKRYDLSWKYKTIKDHQVVYKWKSAKIDLSNTKEIHFIKDQVTKK